MFSPPLPAPRFLQGVHHFARHITFIVLGEHAVGGKSAAGLKLAFRNYTLPFAKQVRHYTLIIYVNIGLAVGYCEGDLQIIAALQAARLH